MASGPPREEPGSAEHGPLDPSAAGEPPPPRLAPRLPAAARPRAAPPTRSARWDAWLPLLNNRAILSGLGLVIVLLLIAIVLVSIGHGSKNTHRPLVTVPTPAADSTVLPRGSMSGHVVTTTGVRNGPDATYALLGTIPKGATIVVIGRNQDQSWLQIRYPPGSALLGWVDAHFLETTGDVSQLAVAGPGPGPSVPIPTSSAPPAETETPIQEEATSTPTEEITPVVTATPTLETQPTPTEQPQQTPTVAPQPTATPAG